MKSFVIKMPPWFNKIQKMLSVFHEDRLTVYASQTSFYICISAIPFIMLLLSASRHIAPTIVTEILGLLRSLVPENLKELFDMVCGEILDKADLPLISTVAVATLWSASRGVWAVVRGVSEVYKGNSVGMFITNLIRSVFYTVIFIAAILLTLILLVLMPMLGSKIFPGGGFTAFVIRFKVIILAILLTVFFTVLYFLVSRGVYFAPVKKIGKVKAECAPESFLGHVPGAVVSALGWILYSYFYSLYIRNFSNFSYIYGSLAAVVFLMLWIYFCIVILLFGAELNKMLWQRKREV